MHCQLNNYRRVNAFSYKAVLHKAVPDGELFRHFIGGKGDA